MENSGISRLFLQRIPIALLLITLAGGGYALFVISNLNQIHAFNRRELGHAAHTLEETTQATLEAFELESWSNADPHKICTTAKSTKYGTFSEESCDNLGQLEDAGEVAWRSGSLSIAWPLSGSRSVSYTIRLGDIIRDLPAPEAFEIVFLVDKTGKVRHETGENYVSLQRVNWRDRKFLQSQVQSHPPVRIGNVSRMSDASGKAMRFEQLKDTAQVSVMLGGESKYLYVQPVELEGEEFLLAASTSSEHTLRTAMAVNSYFLAGIVMLAVVLVLGRAFVKVLLLNDHERFSSLDLYELIFSTAALAVFLILLVFAGSAYSEWSRQQDQHMKELAQALSENVRKELQAARNQLAKYDKEVVDAKLNVLTFSAKPVLDATGKRLSKADYWHEQAAFIRPSGCQYFKTAPDDNTTPQADVKRRPYFAGIASGQAWTIDNESPPFIVHPAVSISDGEFYTFLSMKSAAAWEGQPAKIEKPCSDAERVTGETFVAALTIDLRSTTDQPLPFGYGFAIVNRSGQVLYGSDGRLSLNEDLLREVQPAVRLDSLLQAHTRDIVDLTYRTRPHHFYVQPLDWLKAKDRPSPWALVLYRDVSLARAVAIRITVTALFYALLTTLLVCLPGMIAMAYMSRWVYSRGCSGPRAHASSAWLWPHGGREPAYQKLAVWSACLLSFELLILNLVDGWLLLITSIVLPAIGALMWIYKLYADRDDSDAIGTSNRKPLSSTTGPFLFAAMLFVLCFALPLAAGVFKLFWNEEIGRAMFAVQQDAANNATQMKLAAEEKKRECVQCEKDYIIAANPPKDGGRPGPARNLALLLMPAEDEFGARGLYATRAEMGFGIPGGLAPWIFLFIPIAGISYLWARFYAGSLTLAHVSSSAQQPRAAAMATAAGAGSAAISTNLPPPVIFDFDTWWHDLSPTKKAIMLQISAEGICNPGSKPQVSELIENGDLVLEPDLRPAPHLRCSLNKKLLSEAKALSAWESSESGGWAHAGWGLYAGVGAVVVFAVLTQPGLSTALGGLAPIAAATLTDVRKVLDEIRRWRSS